MKISSTVWWILLATVIIAIIGMAVAFIVMRVKVNKVKKEYSKNANVALEEVNKALVREKHGELLWEMKSSVENPLQDAQMEFLINTFARNEYQTVKAIGMSSDYETESLIQLVDAKISAEKADLTIIENDEDLKDNFDYEYKLLTENKIIAIVNAPRKNKAIKDSINYFKTVGIKYEWVAAGKGIVLVVK